ncbi:DUF4469 domain-containing protein [Gaoshiqia sp. Z1-71]|uniref:DUF4469 domain-containing protein n=1 Tax=Gaoshiqia hydrogeniformans TaxID=3290090 RepID=UPI003BF84BB5
MATQEKSSVIVELYDLALTDRKDDRFGRVVISRSLNQDDLIAIAVARRTDLNASTLKASMDILRNIAIEQIANGASVNFGLGYFNLTVNGVFIGDNARWDSSKHSLAIRVSPTGDLRSAVKSSAVDVRGLAGSGLFVNSVTDVSSGEVNSRITPGGGVNLAGSRMKIEGDDPAVGISLINQETNEVTVIPPTSILVNDPSKITFIVPSGLPAGDYKLSICTRFSTNIQLKEPRTYLFDYVLNVPA